MSENILTDSSSNQSLERSTSSQLYGLETTASEKTSAQKDSDKSMLCESIGSCNEISDSSAYSVQAELDKSMIQEVLTTSGIDLSAHLEPIE